MQKNRIQLLDKNNGGACLTGQLSLVVPASSTLPRTNRAQRAKEACRWQSGPSECPGPPALTDTTTPHHHRLWKVKPRPTRKQSRGGASVVYPGQTITYMVCNTIGILYRFELLLEPCIQSSIRKQTWNLSHPSNTTVFTPIRTHLLLYSLRIYMLTVDLFKHTSCVIGDRFTSHSQ